MTALDDNRRHPAEAGDVAEAQMPTNNSGNYTADLKRIRLNLQSNSGIKGPSC